VGIFEPGGLPKIPEKFSDKKKKYIFSFYMNVFFSKFGDFASPQNRAPACGFSEKQTIQKFLFLKI